MFKPCHFSLKFLYQVSKVSSQVWLFKPCHFSLKFLYQVSKVSSQVWLFKPCHFSLKFLYQVSKVSSQVWLFKPCHFSLKFLYQVSGEVCVLRTSILSLFLRFGGGGFWFWDFSDRVVYFVRFLDSYNNVVFFVLCFITSCVYCIFLYVIYCKGILKLILVIFCISWKLDMIFMKHEPGFYQWNFVKVT